MQVLLQKPGHTIGVAAGFTSIGIGYKFASALIDQVKQKNEYNHEHLLSHLRTDEEKRLSHSRTDEEKRLSHFRTDELKRKMDEECDGFKRQIPRPLRWF